MLTLFHDIEQTIIFLYKLIIANEPVSNSASWKKQCLTISGQSG